MCEAVSDARELAGADLPEGAEAKWQVFKLIERIVGEEGLVEPVDQANLDYLVLDKPEARERAS